MNVSSTRRLCVSFVTLACHLAPVGVVMAAEPASQLETTQGEADRLFERGVAARKEGRLADAEALFRKAWALKKTWDIAANLGLTELNLGKIPEGAEHVLYAMAQLPPSESDAMRENLRKAFVEARREVAGIDVRCDVDGAEVFLNGTSKGTTPVLGTLFAVPGQSTIEVRKDGYTTERRTITVKKGGAETVRIALVKQEPPPERSKVPAIVLGGVSVASLVAGGALFGVSMTAGAELRAGAPRGADGTLLCRKTVEPPSSANAACDAWRAKAADASALGNAGIGLFVTGGIAAAGAVAAYLFWPVSSPSRSAQRWQLAPVAGTDGGGMILQGSF